MDILIHEAYEFPNRWNAKRSTPRHVMIKLPNFNIKRNFWKQEKKVTCHQEKPFKTRNLEVRESSIIHQKYHKKKTLPTQSSKLYMDKLSFKNGAIRYIHIYMYTHTKGLPRFLRGKESAYQCRRRKFKWNRNQYPNNNICILYMLYNMCVFTLYNIYMLYIHLCVC